jgi:DNA polymerase-3 subunit alpha
VILKTRVENGPFTDLFEFCRRVDKRVVNRRVIEALIRAGAFDSLDNHRNKLLSSVGIALEAAEQAERNALQGGLFDMGDGDRQTHYVDVPRWGEREQLLQEKQALGFFLSGHPYNEYARELAAFVKRRLGQLQPQRDPVLLAGVVLSTRTQMTRRGKMAIVMLDDATTQLEVSVFNELWEAERSKIREDELLLVEGKVQKDDYSGGLRITADRLLTLGEARARFAKVLRLSMNGDTRASDARKLQAILTPYRNGGCPVRLAYKNGDAEAEIPLPENWRVNLDDALLTALNDWLTPGNVKVVYA